MLICFCTVTLCILHNNRKIKTLQGHFRAHLGAGQARSDLIARLLDTLLPVMIAHINIVLADRGFDFKNITSYDLSKIKTANLNCLGSAAGSRPILQKLLDDMQTSHFHSLVRAATARIELCRFIFTPFSKAFASIGWKQKKGPIIDFLFFQRKKKLERLRKSDVVVLNIPSFSLEEIKLFIRGGPDPLTTYLETSRLGDNTNRSEEEKIRSAKIVGRDGRLVVQGRRWSEVTLCVLKHTSPEDVLNLLLDIGDAYLEDQKEMRAKIHDVTKKGKLRSPESGDTGNCSIESQNLLSMAVTADPKQDTGASYSTGLMMSDGPGLLRGVLNAVASLSAVGGGESSNLFSSGEQSRPFHDGRKARRKSAFVNANSLGSSVGSHLLNLVDSKFVSAVANSGLDISSGVGHRPSTPPTGKPSNRRKHSFAKT